MNFFHVQWAILHKDIFQEGMPMSVLHSSPLKFMKPFTTKRFFIRPILIGVPQQKRNVYHETKNVTNERFHFVKLFFPPNL